MNDVAFVFALLLTYQAKHFISDYLLQTTWMANGKMKPGWGFLYPLTLHVLIHALLTLTIVLVVNPSLWWLALVDFAAHFTMDRIKSARSLLGRFGNPQKQSFWISFGFDQMVHHLTHYFIIWQLVTNR
ncbi:DUF3307 domain-containing protein [Hyphococcus sp.]|uniref:DUF3307 domain-containing protein n=1 Tax=Hyphococcus sp. TaxID=2038636 RepID=UPI0035C6909A